MEIFGRQLRSLRTSSDASLTIASHLAPVAPGFYLARSVLYVAHLQSPLVSPDGSVVYVGSDDESNNLFAVDAHTGQEIWKRTTGYFCDSSPALSPDGSVLYIGSADSFIYAVDARTGGATPLWKFGTGGAVVSSPALSHNGTVVFCGSDDSFVYAIDSASGALKWKLKTGGAVDSSPAVYGSILYVGSNDKKLYAVDVVTGKKRWEFATGSNISTSSPAVSPDGSMVYIGSQVPYRTLIPKLSTLIHKMRTVQSSPPVRSIEIVSIKARSVG